MGAKKEGISQAALARMLSVTPATVGRALRDGRIPGKCWKQRGKRRVIIDPEGAMKAYRANTSYGGRPPDDPDAAERYAKERAAKLAADRELAELKLAERQGALISVDDVKGTIGSVLVTLRKRMSALPDRLAQELSTEHDAGVIRGRLREELRGVLDAAADGIEKGLDV